MNNLTTAAYDTLVEVWESIYLQSLEHSEPAYLQSLWRMASNISTAYALQHRGAQDHESADLFEWLASICDTHQLMLKGSPLPPKIKNKLKLVVVQSLPRTH